MWGAQVCTINAVVSQVPPQILLNSPSLLKASREEWVREGTRGDLGSYMLNQAGPALLFCPGMCSWQEDLASGAVLTPLRPEDTKGQCFTSKTSYFAFLLSNHICSTVLWETIVPPSQIQAASPKSLTGGMPAGWQGSDATSSVLLLKPGQLHASLRLHFLLANADLL